MSIIAYTDASFDEKRNIAGIGIYIVQGQEKRVYSTWTPAYSINQAELFAIYIAGILTEQRGIIYTDSQTAISYINNQIKDKPRTKEQYIRHKHCELLAYKIRKFNLSIQKVKGHQKNFQTKTLGNNLADLLARHGRSKFYER